TPRPPLCPYTTLFRSRPELVLRRRPVAPGGRHRQRPGRSDLRVLHPCGGAGRGRRRGGGLILSSGFHVPSSRSENRRFRCPVNRSEEHTSELQSHLNL